MFSSGYNWCNRRQQANLGMFGMICAAEYAAEKQGIFTTEHNAFRLPREQKFSVVTSTGDRRFFLDQGLRKCYADSPRAHKPFPVLLNAGGLIRKLPRQLPNKILGRTLRADCGVVQLGFGQIRVLNIGGDHNCIHPIILWSLRRSLLVGKSWCSLTFRDCNSLL